MVWNLRKKWHKNFTKLYVFLSILRGENAFTSDEVWEISRKDYDNFSTSRSCMMYNRNKCIPYVENRRGMCYQGIKVNVNVVSEDDKLWAPLTKIARES